MYNEASLDYGDVNKMRFKSLNKRKKLKYLRYASLFLSHIELFEELHVVHFTFALSRPPVSMGNTLQ